MCMVDDADPWDVVSTLTRTARTWHRCGECHRDIGPGERYEVTEGRTFDQWVTYKVCSHCRVLGAWLVALCRGYIFERVLEDVAEHLHEGIGGPDVARAYAWARIRWGQPYTVFSRGRIIGRGMEAKRVGVEPIGQRGRGLVEVPVPLLVPTTLRDAA